jgi:hypothetical protein
MEPTQIPRPDILQAVEKSMGSTRGVKTRITTDEPDVLDGGDGVDGIGGGGWRRVVECVGLGGASWYC